MKYLIIFLLAIGGNANAAQPEQFIDVQHDARRGVTCWILNGTGISCLPDSQLLRQQPAPSSQSGRASPTNSQHENAQLQATPLLPDEAYQL